jgi:predicted SnoaL-like aldol condensation-catalyzing enzyme
LTLVDHLKEKPVSEANKATVAAFYQKALNEGDVETAFRLYAGTTYRQHNPLIEDGVEGVRKFVAWIRENHPDARGEVKISSPMATTSSCTVTGTACRTIRVEKPSQTSSGCKTARSWSTGM